MGKKHLACLFFVFSQLVTQLRAIPPPAPSAGVVERQLEKDYEANPLESEKEMPAIQIDIPKEKLDIPDGKTVLVKRSRSREMNRFLQPRSSAGSTNP